MRFAREQGGERKEIQRARQDLSSHGLQGPGKTLGFYFESDWEAAVEGLKAQ